MMHVDSSASTEGLIHNNRELAQLPLGMLIAKRYRIVKLLGRGSSGSVFQVQDTFIPQAELALKLFPAKIAKNKIASARIAREVLAGSRLEHPNVVRIYDIVRELGMIGYSMELLHGRPLERGSEIVSGVLPTISALKQVCLGLESIHAAGLVHRDIKPANILITDRNHIKVVDLGLIRGAAPNRKQANAEQYASLYPELLTEQGDLPGTPVYVAPEYIQFGQLDHRCDIYALGVIAYELLTGVIPFPRGSLPELLKFKVESDPPAAHEVNRELDLELSQLIMRALARKPADRIASARSFFQGLSKVEQRLLEAEQVAKNSRAAPSVGSSCRKLLRLPHFASRRDKISLALDRLRAFSAGLIVALCVMFLFRELGFAPILTRWFYAPIKRLLRTDTPRELNKPASLQEGWRVIKPQKSNHKP